MTERSSNPPDALADHRQRAENFRAEATQLEQRATRISLARLLAFIAALVLVSAGVSQASWGLIGGGVATAVAFFVLVFLHAQVLRRQQDAEIRRDVHSRHVRRITGTWNELPSHGDGLLPAEHPYAGDIDLLGHASLFQRLDVTHTRQGERTLAQWLGTAADAETIAARQRAVRELADRVELRQELEASTLHAAGSDKLDSTPFSQFTRRRAFFDGVPWLVPVIHLLPLITVALVVASSMGLVHGALWLLPVAGQTLLVMWTGGTTREAFDLVAARRGYVESFQRALVVVEHSELDAPALKASQQRVSIDGVPPSRYLRRLDRWAGLAELRHQFPVQLAANLLVLWDLHVLYRLERWSRDVGTHIDQAFEALGEIEALSSLATLAHVDADATLPEVAEGSAAFEAEALSHPLLPASSRVPNDVELRGPGSALIVTGSNMAGKSTLLRAVGLNVALALAGGPVIARRLRVPKARLRASMRADDSLEAGASYFHAELTKLRRVVDDADEEPPVFFLLDELLRGTNARARHLGARAVLLHLLERRATGLVATHDVALSALEQEYPDRIGNVHFTDVMRDGEMIFDYKLRSGVVRTSNALRLLRQAGIEVPADEEAASAAPPELEPAAPAGPGSAEGRAGEVE